MWQELTPVLDCTDIVITMLVRVKHDFYDARHLVSFVSIWTDRELGPALGHGNEVNSVGTLIQSLRRIVMYLYRGIIPRKTVGSVGGVSFRFFFVSLPIDALLTRSLVWFFVVS